MTDVNRPQPFDEQAALAELERLAEKIQTSRRQRAQAVEEFDAFVRAFRTERRLESIRAAEAAISAASAPAVSEDTSPPAAPFIPLVAQSIATAEPIAPIAPLRAPRSGGQATDVRTPPVVRSADRVSDPRIRWAIAFVAVVALALLVLRPWRVATPPSPSTSAATSTAAPVTSAAPQTPGANPAPTVPASPRALNLELVTIRPVWTRVTVDDKRTIEREIPGGQRLALGADRSIGIRAGDAGAIRVIVDGKDLGVLGKDGQIANRSFAARGR